MGFTVTAVTPTTIVRNDVKKALDTGVAYQVVLAFLGEDTTNGGYTITQSTSAPAAVTLTAGQALSINVPVANLPAGAANTPTIAVFLKAGAGNYTLSEFAYLDSTLSQDFNHIIVNKPLASAPGNFTFALLNSITADSTLGSRRPVGWDFTTLSPTTGGVTVTRQVTQVTVAPDTSADFQIVTTRTAQIAFQLLPNDIIDVVKGNAGDYVTYTASSGKVIQEAQMSLNTAAALITGNRPLKLLLPPDSQGLQEVRVYLGQLLQNQQQNEEAWTKTAPNPISYTYSAVSLDKLIISEHSEIQWKNS
jgi:hypothetical protein